MYAAGICLPASTLYDLEPMKKYCRKKFGIKQADLARHMNLTPSVLSDYEKGRRPSPGVKFIKRYLLALYELVESNGKSTEQAVPTPVASVHINQP